MYFGRARYFDMENIRSVIAKAFPILLYSSVSYKHSLYWKDNILRRFTCFGTLPLSM
jgi:hypothetical protein